MEKNENNENVRKTLYMKKTLADRLDVLAKGDDRTFSSWVVLLLEKATHGLL